jgi:hypothetical protein
MKRPSRPHTSYPQFINNNQCQALHQLHSLLIRAGRGASPSMDVAANFGLGNTPDS